jgi:hypothetical protein
VAKDFGRTDYWAPESDLDSDPGDPGVDYVCAEGRVINVKPNDWLDVDETIPRDPYWGSSFQVLECKPAEILVRMYNKETDLYEPQALSPNWVWNNYRRVPVQ